MFKCLFERASRRRARSLAPSGSVQGLRRGRTIHTRTRNNIYMNLKKNTLLIGGRNFRADIIVRPTETYVASNLKAVTACYRYLVGSRRPLLFKNLMKRSNDHVVCSRCL